MIEILDMQLDENVERGAKGGPMFKTDIQSLDNGREFSNRRWQYPLHRFNVGYGDSGGLRPEDWADLKATFMNAEGRAYGFLFKDWSDYSATDVVLGTGNGATTAFQTRKIYTKGSLTKYRKITRVKSDTLVVKDNGSTVSGSDYTLNASTGLITFDVAPLNAHSITASYEFYVPVRFEEDFFEIELLVAGYAGGVEDFYIVEVRE